MRVRDRIGISHHRQRQLSRALTFGLVGILAIGLERGNTGVIVNTAIGLVVTQLPPLLERDFEIPLDPALTLWITTAVFLHALGTVGLPGSEQNFYVTEWWWDHVTHALSSSVVAAVGYTTVRALDKHSEDLYLPGRFTFVFILLFVMAFGVFWEVIEFAVSEGAAMLGTDTVLTQYGLDDTMLDLVFDTVGAVIVAIWGTAHLNDVVGVVAEYLEGRAA